MNLVMGCLYLGDMRDARYAPDDMDVLCVMWESERKDWPPRCTQIATAFFDERAGLVKVDVQKMDEAADWIHARVTKGKSVLVHCAYGMERSPLTVVWYLMRYRGMNLTQAYELVEQQRPQTLYRAGWLPVEIRLSGQLPAREGLTGATGFSKE